MNAVPRAKRLLQEIEKLVPARTWKLIRKARGKGKKGWPGWSYFPTGEFVNLVWTNQLLPLEIVLKGLGPLHILSAWRATQGMYRFDRDLLDELVKTPITGKIPVEALTYLPEWCVYVALPEPVTFGAKSFEGFFATLSSVDGTLESASLDIGWVNVLHNGLEMDGLPLRGTLEESLQYMMETVIAKRDKADGGAYTRLNEHDRKDLEERFNFVLPILLYLASEDRDVESPNGDGTVPRKKGEPTTKKRAKNKSHSPRCWEVGWRVGPKLRKAREEYAANGVGRVGNGVSPRPHVRRGHWHHYWTGSTKDPSGRKLILKWLHPILVNVEDPDDLVPTFRDVD